MSLKKTIRVMWLLNHTSAREFEIPMLKKLGIKEIFLPKIVPDTPLYRSASIDFSEDQELTIPEVDLDYLNRIDWYDNPTIDAINVANKYFDLLFFIATGPLVSMLAKHFNGFMILRAYGLPESMTYQYVINQTTNGIGAHLLKSLKTRFWFGQAFQNINSVEPDYIKEQSIHLPLGSPQRVCAKEWTGSNKVLFFICPDIGFNTYSKGLFEKFKSDFSDFPYVIGGTQSIMPTKAENIPGYRSRQQHDINMSEFRVMFYYSQEPRHLHYHPVEAIQAGMPLVFMAGGVLDQMGGKTLPGRCKTIAEARHKIQRILNDDWGLVNQIREAQQIILDSIGWSNCEAAWAAGFAKIFHAMDKPQQVRPLYTNPKRKKIAIIVPIGYRGGSLKGAKNLAEVIYKGSQEAGESVDVIFAHLDAPDLYTEVMFSDLHPDIQTRPYTWLTLTASEAHRAMRYAGFEDWSPVRKSYVVPNDQINQFMDCDLWIVISDRIPDMLLPIRPVVYMIYDYLQRYVPSVLADDQLCLDAVNHAEKVLVTTNFTCKDAVQYAGLPLNKVVKVPMLAPIFLSSENQGTPSRAEYFVWTTSAAVHKNHDNAFMALQIYYEKMNGKLDCYITGVNTKNLLTDPPERLESIAAQYQRSTKMQTKMIFSGELSEMDYQNTLSKAAFNWHAGIIDNGTFTVIEAASLGVPALSSDYPAMREIDQQFGLNLLLMDQYNPKSMAEKLKEMELTYQARRALLPTKEKLMEQHPDKLANQYWEVIRECL